MFSSSRKGGLRPIVKYCYRGKTISHDHGIPCDIEVKNELFCYETVCAFALDSFTQDNNARAASITRV